MAPKDPVHRASPPARAREPVSRGWLAGAAGLGALAVVLAVLYALLVRSAVFSQPTQRATIGSGAGRAEDGLAAEATVLSIDPVTNTFQVRL